VSRLKNPLAAALLVQLVTLTASAQVPAPESHFGFRMGADRQLATATDIERYFELVDQRSDRVTIVDVGPTTEGHRTIAAIVSAPDNLAHLPQIRADNQRLADPRTLSPDDARRLAATHKVVLAIGGGIHASEVGATQMANELLYWLATSNDPDVLDTLDKVVVILIPSLNPDGHRLVVDWYTRTKNTEFEGKPLPGLFHKYAGHDINRDAFMMNMAESRNLARFLYEEWHAQVWLSLHEMGSGGPRMFVPPVSDPIGANYDPVIWREGAMLGSAMALELQREGRSGVVSNGLFDYYWPGYEDSAPLGHNTVCLLAEVAGVNIASPIRASEAGGQASNPTPEARINDPDPWRGGPWTLRDVVDYELTAIRGLLRAVAAYRSVLVQNFYDMGRRAVEQGGRGGPFAFIIPPDQYDAMAVARLEDLLLRGGVEIHRALEPFRADGEPYPTGSDIVLLAQPYRAYVKTLLERQRYPARRVASGEPPDQPYDVTGWTLPAQMSVAIRTIERAFEPPAMTRLAAATIQPEKIWGDAKPSYYVIDTHGNGGAIAINRLAAASLNPAWLAAEIDVNGYRYGPGSVIVPSTKTARPIIEKIASGLGLRADGVKRKPQAAMAPIGAARVALYKPWVTNADEGWSRWLLEQYEFKFKSVTDADLRGGDLRRRYDIVILPSASAEHLLSGLPSDAAPAEYTGGLAEAGTKALRDFVEAGGTLVGLNQAGGFAIDHFKLPVRDVVREASTKEFFAPGSIVKIDLDPAQPLAYGMSSRTAAFFTDSSAFDVEPNRTSDVQVVARYGENDLLVSGWLDGESIIAGKPAVIQVRVGSGRVILIGFAAQHRAQSLATFRLLFNSIFTAPQPARTNR
jgi:zinc carboxypeptidase